MELTEELERPELLVDWFCGGKAGGRPVETSRPPQSPVGSGRWWVHRRRALKRKPDASHDRGGWEVTRANSWVRRLEIIQTLEWNVDLGTQGNTPSLLDTWLDKGPVIVEAFSPNSARRKRHI